MNINNNKKSWRTEHYELNTIVGSEIILKYSIFDVISETAQDRDAVTEGRLGKQERTMTGQNRTM